VRALWLEGGELSLREDLPRPEPVAGEVRVAVRLAGICGTDLALARGYMGYAGIPGHEFVGVALEGALEGRRVVGEINAACGVCAPCGSGQPRHCSGRTVLGILGRGGAHAEVLSLPGENLHQVPDGVSDEQAVFVEPLAAAFEILEQVSVSGNTSVLVMGDGKLGLLCAQVLALRSSDVALAGRHGERVGMCAGVRSVGTAEQARASGEGWEVVVEATGDPSVIGIALACVRPLGTLVLKTTAEAGVPLDLAPLVVNEVTMVGSRCGPFEPALAALADNQIQVETLIETVESLQEGVSAYERARRSGTLKILLKMCPEDG